jgi:hypothetical protein
MGGNSYGFANRVVQVIGSQRDGLTMDLVRDAGVVVEIPAYPSPLLLLNANVGPPHLRRDEPISLALCIHAGPHQPKMFELLSELLLTGIRHGTSASPSPMCRAWWIAPQRG